MIVDNLSKIFHVLKEMNNFKNSFDRDTQDLIDEIYLAWPTLDWKTKMVKFSKHACHELNFFLFKRDKPFFNEIVKPFIRNKMEKTFVDWYLLAIECTPNQFTERILSYIDGFSFYEELNGFELCLLIDICMSKGNALQKKQAITLAQ